MFSSSLKEPSSFFRRPQCCYLCAGQTLFFLYLKNIEKFFSHSCYHTKLTFVTLTTEETKSEMRTKQNKIKKINEEQSIFFRSCCNTYRDSHSSSRSSAAPVESAESRVWASLLLLASIRPSVRVRKFGSAGWLTRSRGHCTKRRAQQGPLSSPPSATSTIGSAALVKPSPT